MTSEAEAAQPYNSVPQVMPDEPVLHPPSEEDSIKLAEVIIQARPDGTQIIPTSLQPAAQAPGWVARLCSCFKYRPNATRRRRRNTSTEFMIGPQRFECSGRPTLVLDLDETLVHSSFQPLAHPDFILPFDLDGKTVYIHVLKRPRLDEFLEKVGEKFEVVVFTASQQRYADPLIDRLDPHSIVSHRLYRENCTLLSGGYVKDISRLGRSLKRTIIVDIDNALDIESWYDDKNDGALMTLLPVLEALAREDDVRAVIPELKRRRKLQDEDSAKTGTDTDTPPIARLPKESPPSHRGYYNSPRAQAISFDTLSTARG